MAEDMPMNLYAFEYLARGALLSFWEWLNQRHGIGTPKSEAHT